MSGVWTETSHLKTMLTQTSVDLLAWIYEYSYFLKVIPYYWNKTSFRLNHDESWTTSGICTCIDLYFCGYEVYIILVFIAYYPFDGVDNPTIIIHAIGILGFLVPSLIVIWRRIYKRTFVCLINQFIAFCQSFQGKIL